MLKNGLIAAGVIVLLGTGLGLGLYFGLKETDTENDDTTTTHFVSTTSVPSSTTDQMRSTTTESWSTTEANRHIPQEYDWPLSLGDNVLDQFVKQSNPYTGYQYLDKFTIIGRGYQTYVLNFTSQAWSGNLDQRELPLWSHELFINVPIDNSGNFDISGQDIYGTEIPIHFITDCHGPIDSFFTENYRPNLKNYYLNYMQKMATDLKTVTFFMNGVPPQINGDSSDFNVATSWINFMKSNNTDELIEFAAVKSLSGAMQVVREFLDEKILETQADQEIKIPDFYNCIGGSKNGWFCYLLAAVEHKKVKSIYILSFEYLRIQKQIHHHYRSLGGGYSVVMTEYFNAGVTQYVDTPMLDEFCKYVDPWSYRSRYAETQLNIYHVTATNDGFMLLGSNLHFLQDLKLVYDEFNGPTAGDAMIHFNYLRNTIHLLAGRFIFNDLIYKNFLALSLKTLVPKFRSFEVNSENLRDNSTTIVIESNVEPTELTLFMGQSLTNQTMDFRFVKIVDSELELDENLRFVSHEPVEFQNTLFRQVRPNTIRPIDSTDPVNYPFAYESKSFRYDSNVFEDYSAVYVKAKYVIDHKNDEDADDQNYIFLTSQINFFPKLYPIEDCYGEECYGKIV